MYRSTNRRSSVAEPEVWFRIVHITLDGADGAPVAAYREQTVEIALGPKGAFENGNVGTLTRRVPADAVVSAVPPPRGKPKPPKEPRTPRVVELLRKALEWQALLESGEVRNGLGGHLKTGHRPTPEKRPPRAYDRDWWMI
jgi:hypothetical protein